MSTAASASMLAHGVHYGLIAVGMAGLAVLLLPQALHRSSSGGTAVGRAPRATVALPTDSPAALLLPIVLVGSTAAAGVHAAMTPPHLSRLPLFALFFGACALAQVAWTALLLVAPSRPLLWAGVVGNGGLIALWAGTRVAGMEPVGAWDLACALWEAGVVAGCLVLLRASYATRTAPLAAWRPTALVWLVTAIGGLALLSLTGVSG
jgi:hypothetical protein